MRKWTLERRKSGHWGYKSGHSRWKSGYWKSSGASKLLSNLVQADIIEPVFGHGKEKYKFKK